MLQEVGPAEGLSHDYVYMRETLRQRWLVSKSFIVFRNRQKAKSVSSKQVC